MSSVDRKIPNPRDDFGSPEQEFATFWTAKLLPRVEISLSRETDLIIFLSHTKNEQIEYADFSPVLDPGGVSGFFFLRSQRCILQRFTSMNEWKHPRIVHVCILQGLIWVERLQHNWNVMLKYPIKVLLYIERKILLKN